MRTCRQTVISRAFTLVELLASIAIMAVLATAALFFVIGYSNWAKETADKQTLAILNDALTRYKCQGGNMAALTAGAPVSSIIATLKTTVTWGGQSHTFLQNSFTLPAKSLSVTGTRSQYRFTRFNSFANEAGGVTSPNLNSSAGGLLCWWKFDESSGSTAADSAGNHTATLGGTNTPQWVTGIKGNALSFAGNSSYLSVPMGVTNPDLDIAGNVTIAAWVKPSANGGIILRGGGGADVRYSLFHGATYAFQYYDNGYKSSNSNTGTSFNQWAHVCVVRNGTTASFYINGVAAGGGTVTPPSCTYVTGGLYIGGGLSAQWFTGVIDDMRLYNRALSAEEVQQLYNL